MSIRQLGRQPGKEPVNRLQQAQPTASADPIVAAAAPPVNRRRLWVGLVLAATACAFLLAIWLAAFREPPPPPLTTDDVDAIVAQRFDAMTPAPAYSAQVYAIILPSLVFIETEDEPPMSGSLARSVPPVPVLQAPQLANGASASTSAMAAIRWQDEVEPDNGDEPSAESGDEPEGELPDEDEETPPAAPRLGIGSGVVVNSSGVILTALHVVEDAAIIKLTFADGTEAQGTIVGAEPDNDIALLQADRLPEIFAPATLGNPGAMRVGDEVYAVGNPLGLAGSISAGVISGFDRTFQSPYGVELDRLIQFDAAVNPGNSGGPLLNRNGEVIGIVVGLLNPAPVETFIGIGLAVRIDTAGGVAGLPPQ